MDKPNWNISCLEKYFFRSMWRWLQWKSLKCEKQPHILWKPCSIYIHLFRGWSVVSHTSVWDRTWGRDTEVSRLPHEFRTIAMLGLEGAEDMLYALLVLGVYSKIHRVISSQVRAPSMSLSLTKVQASAKGLLSRYVPRPGESLEFNHLLSNLEPLSQFISDWKLLGVLFPPVAPFGMTH